MNKTLIFFGLAFLISLSSKASPANLAINLNGYVSDIHKNYAEVLVPDVNYPYNEQIKLSENGSLSVSLIIPDCREIIFSYDGHEIPIIISPNDNIELEFTIEEVLSYGSRLNAKVSGNNEETNLLIYRFSHVIDDWISESNNAFMADKTMGYMNYRSLRENEAESHILQLIDLIKNNTIDNVLFYDWAEAKIMYAAGKDLCLYPFMGRFNKTITDKDEYFKFIKDLEPKNEYVGSMFSYSGYLNSLITSLTIIGNISNKYEEERINLKKDSLSRFPIKYNLIAKNMENRQREIALTNIYLNSTDIPTRYIDSLNNYLNVADINKIGVKDKNRNTPILKLLANFDLANEEKNVLEELYNSTKGKVVFHDFWFLGCAPCMKELPHYNELIKKSGDEVEYVFFGVYMEKEKWEAKILELELKGKHYLLSKNQVAFYERYFMLKGYPHHQLVDGNGLIKNEHIPRVDPTNFELIINKLGNVK